MSEFVRKNGTYCFVSGPMYESKAECKFLRSIGGDSVGMSTVPEIVAAHHSGMKVLCLSLITNKVIITGDEGPPASHEEVLEAVNTRSEQIQDLVKEIVKELKMTGVLDSLPQLSEINLDAFPKKKKAITLCPYHLVTSIPLHCWMMGFAAVTFGAILKKRN